MIRTAILSVLLAACSATSAPQLGGGDDAIPAPEADSRPLTAPGVAASDLRAGPTAVPAGTFSDPEPIPGVAPPPLQYPVRTAVGDDGTVYVTDTKTQAVFGYHDGHRVLELTGIVQPLGIAVHGDFLYVGSVGTGAVGVYDLDTEALIGALGSGIGEFVQPNDIAIAPDGSRVFVADSRADRVAIYNRAGALVHSIDGVGEGPGELRFPVAVAADSARLAVAESTNVRVQIFDHDGGYIGAVGGRLPDSATSSQEYAGSFVRPQAVALARGHLLVLDAFFGHIQVFGSDGSPLGYVGRRGTCPGCVDLALDMALTPTGTAIVTDPERGRWIEQTLDVRALP